MSEGENKTERPKQPRLLFCRPSTSTLPFVDGLIMQYIVSEMRPLSTVESDPLKALVKGLCPSASVICRQTLKEKIYDSFLRMKTNLQAGLDKATYVCTVADLWSSSNRSFWGMTVHWIDGESLDRKSAALTCMRFIGKQSYDKIAAAISETHARLSLTGK